MSLLLKSKQKTKREEIFFIENRDKEKVCLIAEKRYERENKSLEEKDFMSIRFYYHSNLK